MKTGTTGTGPSLRIPANKGATIGRSNIGKQSTSSIKAPQAQANSQRGTTAPAVSMPPAQLIKDTKARTTREKAVDGWLKENAAQSGGDQFMTYYERYKAEVAKGDGHTGTPNAGGTLKGKSRQAQ